MESRSPKDCRPSRAAEFFRQRGWWWVFDLLYGLESRIPLCCVLAFVYDDLRYKSVTGRDQYGVWRESSGPTRPTVEGMGWCPCPFHLYVSQSENSE